MVLDRNKLERMSHAYYNRDIAGRSTRSFIQPLPKYKPGYDCLTSAYTGANDSLAPVRDHGRIIPDQEDRIRG